MKNLLAQNLTNAASFYADEYNFFPKTWVLPKDSASFRAQFYLEEDPTFIIKPIAACQGRGIFLSKTYGDVYVKPGDQFVA